MGVWLFHETAPIKNALEAHWIACVPYVICPRALSAATQLLDCVLGCPSLLTFRSHFAASIAISIVFL